MQDPAVPTARSRQHVWWVLSQLFLDTELSDSDIAAMARDLKAAGFSKEALQHIYETEVAPVCSRNLMAVPGGIWAGFDAVALGQAIEAHLAAQRPAARSGWRTLWSSWQRYRHTRLTRGDWDRLVRQLDAMPGGT